jgi:hypothetical protein
MVDASFSGPTSYSNRKTNNVSAGTTTVQPRRHEVRNLTLKPIEKN